MKIEVYSDIVCPWCYIGEKRLAQALTAHPDLAVERVWRPFQLRPEMPPQGQLWAAFAAEKFGGAARAAAMFAQVTEAGAPDGAVFRFDRVASAPNTTDAHRLVLLAREHGREWAMADALFAAYFAEGRDLNDRNTLVALAVGAGLDADAVNRHLDGDEGAMDVWESQQTAASYGIASVPTYVIDDRYAVVGAQPAPVFAQILAQIIAAEPSARAQPIAR